MLTVTLIPFGSDARLVVRRDASGKSELYRPACDQRHILTRLRSFHSDVRRDDLGRAHCDVGVRRLDDRVRRIDTCRHLVQVEVEYLRRADVLAQKFRCGDT